MCSQNKTAYALARMETALQERLANMLPNLPTGSRAEELLELAKAGTNWRPTFSCPDGSRVNGETHSYGMTWTVATVSCARVRPAVWIVHGLRLVATLVNACAPRPRQPERRRGMRRRPKRPNATQKSKRTSKRNVQLRAKRLAAAADAAGLENEASILISEYGRGLTVGKLRDWAAGHFEPG